MDAPAQPTAAVLLIGNELLSGKIRDENGHFLSVALRRRGVSLLRMVTVPDDLHAIGEALIRLLELSPVVFTSGGVGPTHDDITMEAIAAATGRPLERHPGMAKMLREHYGEEITPAALSMADVPRGTSLRADAGWPVLRLDLSAEDVGPGRPPEPSRIYILPGIPSLLRAKYDALEAIPGELPRGDAWDLQVVRTTLSESRLAEILTRIGGLHPDVEIGSYPRWIPDADGRLRIEVRVTLEASGAHAKEASAAREALLAALGPDLVLADPDSEAT